jgi:5'-nucleotidase
MTHPRSLVLVLALCCACPPKEPDDSTPPDCTGDSCDTGDTGAAPLRLTLLHTNDWHSHLLGYGPDAEYTPGSTGDDATIGGLARIATLADEIRGASPDPVLMFDAGDWMEGSLFQILATSHAAELQVMQLLGYDAITLGNHEYSWGPGTLAAMIQRGDELGVTVPIVASNILPDDTSSADDALAALLDSGRIETTRVLTLDNGTTVGLFGILGEEAAAVAPGAAPVTFEEAAVAATRAVEDLQAQGVDLVVMLSHSGVTGDPSTSPDELIAAAVPGIDVIVGGHSHTTLTEPTVVGSTLILQAGSYARYLGQLDLVWDGTAWQMEGYTQHPIDDSIAGDPEVTAKVDELVAAMDAGPLATFGYGFADPVLHVSQDVLSTGCVETGLGHYVTDAYVAAMNATGPAAPIDFAFESHGVIRDGLSAGDSGVQAFSDLFRVMPLGFNATDQGGYPLVDFWVTAQELEGVCEVTASISPLFGCDYFIEMSSGLRCTVDMLGVPFTRVDTVEVDLGGGWQTLDTSSANDTLYHVAVDSYVASLMGVLESLTSGLIAVTPKDAAGQPVAGVEGMIFDADPSTGAIDPLKLWQALVGYAETFEDADGDGIPELPTRYEEPTERIVGYAD